MPLRKAGRQSTIPQRCLSQAMPLHSYGALATRAFLFLHGGAMRTARHGSAAGRELPAARRPRILERSPPPRCA
jgi:hypothetical protein